MISYKEEYDKSIRENQRLRDALIRVRRELENVRNNPPKVVMTPSQQRPVVQQESTKKLFLQSNKISVLWLTSGNETQLKNIASKLSSEDILISEVPNLCGQIIEGVPVCSQDVLKELESKPFVLIQGNNYDIVKKRLDSLGYKEYVEFDALDKYWSFM